MNVLRSLGTRDERGRRFRRGVFLLPSLFTLANLFCGYACIVHAMRRDFDMAALCIALVVLAYSYLASALVGYAWLRLRRRGTPEPGPSQA